MSGGGIISTLILVLPHLFYPCAAALPHPSMKEDAFCLLPPSKQGLLSFQVYSNPLNDLWQHPYVPLPWPCCRRAFLEYFWILGAKRGCTRADWLRAHSSFLFHVCGMCWRDAHQLSLAVWDEGQPVKWRILDVGIMKKRRNIAMERLLWIVLNALQPFVKLTGPKMCFRSFESKPAVKELYFLSHSCNGKYICLPRQSCKKYC